MITIKKEENGTYSARVRYKDAYGNVHQKRMNGYTRKKDLEDDYAKLIANPTQTVVVNKKDKQKTLLEIYEEWKEEYEKKVRFSTVYTRDMNFKNYLANVFFDRPIAKIQKNEIESFIHNNIQPNNISAIKLLVTTIKTVFNFAEKKYSIPNIAKDLELPHIEQLSNKEKIKIISPDIFEALLKECSFSYQVLFQALYRTGMRIGEALALTWDDVDLEKQTISISKSISVVGTSTKKHRAGVGRTKNNSSVRTIKIDTKLVELLKQYKSQFSVSNGMYLWRGEKPLMRQGVNDYLNRKLKQIGVDANYTAHAFRHTHASMLLSKGVPIPAVSHRLGHKNTLITMSTYSHFIPSDEETIVNIIKDF